MATAKFAVTGSWGSVSSDGVAVEMSMARSCGGVDPRSPAKRTVGRLADHANVAIAFVLMRPGWLTWVCRSYMPMVP